jgi:AcrR family transcriptional regulator
MMQTNVKATQTTAKEKLPAKAQILETAARLFYHKGFRAVGVDTIIAESGVAKMTFYKHFPSKDDLIVAYLELSNQHFWTWCEAVIKPLEGKPKRQLETIFEGIAARSSSPQCLGCTFTVAASEFPELDHPGHKIAIAHKEQVLAKFEALAKAAKLKQSKALAESLLMLMDGAWNAARIFGAGSYAKGVAEAAKILIAAHDK